MSERSAYLNGKWVSPAEVSLPVDDPGFLWGATVSERLRTFGGRVFQFEEHLQRLAHSLQIVGLPARPICDEIGVSLPEVVQRSQRDLVEGDDLGVVVLVTPPRKDSSDGSRPYATLAIYATPLPFADWASKYEAGDRLVISKYRQVPSWCWPSELKCRSRMHYFLADLEARQRDQLARALLLDQQGHLAEASTANVLLAREGRIVSPRPDDILPGISLSFVRELAEAEGIPFNFQDISPTDAANADEIMLASTSPCLLPVSQLDGVQVGGTIPGPLFERLITNWSRHVGLDIRAQAKNFANRS